MGDDLGNEQFDFDEDAFVASSAAADLSAGSDGEDSLAEDVDEAKLRKKELKKRKFAEMKEKKKKKLKVEDGDDAATGMAVSSSAVDGESASAAYELLMTCIRNTPHRSADIPEDMIFKPKVARKADMKPKCPFFLAIQTKLPDFQNMKKKPGDEVGSPLVIIVSAGAVRSVEIMKTLSRFAQCKIAKLFAKHFKVEEQVDMLREHHPLAVGTPNRLNKLIDIGALSLSNTRLVLVDMAADDKSFTLLNSPNVRDDFFKFIVENAVPQAPNLHIALVR